MLHTHEVTGSSPVVSTNKNNTTFQVVLFLLVEIGLEHILSQHAGGMLLPPVETLVASFIFASGENVNRVLLSPITPPFRWCYFYWRRSDSNRSYRNMPVACCCHQCKHWWLPLFSPPAKMQIESCCLHPKKSTRMPIKSAFGPFLFYRERSALPGISNPSRYRFSIGIHSSKKRFCRKTGRFNIRCRWVSSSTVSRSFQS